MRLGIIAILMLLSCACATVLGAPESAAQEELSPFSGTLGDAIWTVLAFLILLFVLWKFAWKRILEGLTAREIYIGKQIREAEETKKDAQIVLSQYQDKLNAVEKEGRLIVDARTREAEKEARRILDDAKKDAETLRLRQEMDMERARRQAESELLDQAGGIVLQLGEEILERSLQDGDHQKFVDQAIARLKHTAAQDAIPGARSGRGGEGK
ncbi:MAG: F0F1 ATP synthase subunit B [Phycisphaerae bacterium]|nr:F0F1 ATP synthase subunit B [Phycisphaerae bacterium]